MVYEFKVQKLQDDRPPADWWDRCTSAVSENPDVDDPESLCGWIWYWGMKHSEKTQGFKEPQIPRTVEEIRMSVNEFRKSKGK